MGLLIKDWLFIARMIMLFRESTLKERHPALIRLECHVGVFPVILVARAVFL